MPMTDEVVVRRLQPDDLEVVTDIDQRSTGRRREAYLRLKLEQALADTGIQISLVAVREGGVRGFCLARLYYGEFGRTDTTAVLDTIGVHPDVRGTGVGQALMEQLRTNLRGIGVDCLQTDVSWDNQGLLSFFHHQGFEPAPRLCLDLRLDARCNR